MLIAMQRMAEKGNSLPKEGYFRVGTTGFEPVILPTCCRDALNQPGSIVQGASGSSNV